MAGDPHRPERPGAEAEILPPERLGGEPAWRQSAWHGYGTYSQRIYVTRLGPLGVILLMLMIGGLAAVILLALLGAVLIWIPVVALVVAAGAVFRLLRR